MWVHTHPPRLGWGERAGLKGSLFPHVIIPKQGNRNVLKTPLWTLLTGAGVFGCTVAPLFLPACLGLPAHLLHPPLPQNNQPVIKNRVFSLHNVNTGQNAWQNARAGRVTLRQQGQHPWKKRCLSALGAPRAPQDLTTAQMGRAMGISALVSILVHTKPHRGLIPAPC